MEMPSHELVLLAVCQGEGSNGFWVWEQGDQDEKKDLRAARRLVKLGLGQLTITEQPGWKCYEFKSYLAPEVEDSMPLTPEHPDLPEVDREVAVPEGMIPGQSSQNLDGLSLSTKYISEEGCPEEVSSPDPEYMGVVEESQVSLPGLSPEEENDRRAARQPTTIKLPRPLHAIAGGAPEATAKPVNQPYSWHPNTDNFNLQLVARFPINPDHTRQRNSIDDDLFSGENIAIAELLWEKLMALNPQMPFPVGVITPVPHQVYREFCRCADAPGFFGEYEFRCKALIQDKWGVDAPILAVRNLVWHFTKEHGAAMHWLENQPAHVDIIDWMLQYVTSKGGEWYDEPTSPRPVTEIQHPLGLDVSDPKVQAVVQQPPLATWSKVGTLGLRRLWSTKDDPLGNIRELRRHRDPKREKARQDKVKKWEAARNAQRSGVLHAETRGRLDEGRVQGAGQQ